MLQQNCDVLPGCERNDEMKKMNLHAHTDWSDGYGSPLQALRYAIKHNMILGITDHNTIRALQELLDWAGDNPERIALLEQHIVPGIEVQSRGGPELLFYFKDIQTLHDFYEKEILLKKKLNRSNPIFEGMDYSALELAQLCRSYDGDIGIPHPRMKIYGIYDLQRKERKSLLRFLKREQKDHVHTERNPHVSAWRNIKAIIHAKRNRFPLITNADTHDGEFDSSHTMLQLAPTKEGETHAQRVLRSIHINRPKLDDQHLEQPSLVKTVIRGIVLPFQMGIRGTSTHFRKRMKYAMGY